jgi:biopolymer transport protein ExbB/TolQ
MGTTLLGLLSAVPLLVIVGLLNMNSERLIQEMEEKGLKIINSLS